MQAVLKVPKIYSMHNMDNATKRSEKMGNDILPGFQKFLISLTFKIIDSLYSPGINSKIVY